MDSPAFDGGADAGDAGPDGPETPTNCAYPAPGRADPGVLAKTSALAAQACRLQLGAPRTLPFMPALAVGDSGVLAFSFDVNGDEVGDIFFWESAREPVGLKLAVSRAVAGQVSYDRVECDALNAIPWGRVFVRDLNQDGVPDLVVGPSTLAAGGNDQPDVAAQAFLNLPTGFVEVVRHEWPEAGKTTLLDVAVADLGGSAEDLGDVAFGYDRFAEADMLVEIGISVDQIDSSTPSDSYRMTRWASWGVRGELNTPGQLAAGGDFLAPWLFVAQHSLAAIAPGALLSGLAINYDGADLTEMSVEFETPLDSAATQEFGPYDAWTASFAGREALALLFGRAVVFYDASDLTVRPLPVLLTLPTVFEHSYEQALGGGGYVARRFMIDVDGDGGRDFVERINPELDRIAIHRGRGGVEFLPPIELQVSQHLDGLSESPFVRVAGSQGAILVNDASTSPGPGAAFGPPTFQMLECASP